MDIKEKKELRNELLKGLYEQNEQSGGQHLYIEVSWPMNDEDKKRHLAYEYLRDKGYIDYRREATSLYLAKINAYGIDYVESEMQ